MSASAIKATAEIFESEIRRLWAEAVKPWPITDCPKCGARGVPASQIKPGLCWLCEEE